MSSICEYLSYPSYRLMRYSCSELLEDILPPLLLASDSETRLEWFIDPSEETFDDCLGEYLINDNLELEWCPALSSDGRDGSLHQDGELELGPVPSLSPDVRADEDFLDSELEKNVSSSPSADLMVSCPESLESESCDSGIEVYALSSDGRDGSLHRDGESELGLLPSLSPDVRAVEDFPDSELENNVSSTNLLMSSSPSADLMVSCPESLESDSGNEVCSGEEFDWSRLITPTDIGIDQFTCLFLVSKEDDCKLEFFHVNLYDSMKSNLTR